MADQSDIEHLLRRTEFVARPGRVAALTPMSIAQAVDDILAVPGNPGSVTFTEEQNWQRGEEYTHYWLDRMAHDSPKPIQEKMAFFWHGHFCSEFSKVNSAELMRDQIDTFRHRGLGNLRSLAIEMSTQVAMLRYLDNNRNKQSSPNQNFARELMELFLLGVGNYTEADVEAGTAAWTGHTDDWQTDAYVWRGDWHDGSTKSFLGRPINAGQDATKHGQETIETILGTGKVPSGASIGANRGRATRDVAAEFISRKLWIEFAGTEPPSAVINAMRTEAIASDFDITRWLRVMLNRPEFYATDVRQGLVRSPVEMIVAMLAATGLRSKGNTPLWLMEGMGQRPLFPPNVSGWKHNSYWVNASAMGQRSSAANHIAWRTMRDFWNDDGDRRIHLAGGDITRDEIRYTYAPVALVARIFELMQVSPSPTSRSALDTYAANSEWWERNDLVGLALMMPEMNVA